MAFALACFICRSNFLLTALTRNFLALKQEFNPNTKNK
jgi:hypothetical protein